MIYSFNMKNALIITLIGSITGIITSFGQTYIPGTFNQLANSYAVWLTASFVGGYYLSSKKWAITGGILIQIIAIISYYFTSYLRFDMSFGSYGVLLFWIAGGIVMGPVLGLVGHWWRHERQDKDQYAIALLSALYLSEAMRNLYEFGYNVGYAFLIIGICIIMFMYRKKAGILKLSLITLSLTACMYVVLYNGLGT